MMITPAALKISLKIGTRIANTNPKPSFSVVCAFGAKSAPTTQAHTHSLYSNAGRGIENEGALPRFPSAYRLSAQNHHTHPYLTKIFDSCGNNERAYSVSALSHSRGTLHIEQHHRSPARSFTMDFLSQVRRLLSGRLLSSKETAVCPPKSMTARRDKASHPC